MINGLNRFECGFEFTEIFAASNKDHHRPPTPPITVLLKIGLM
jgi:hypothetical protein